MIRFHGVEHFEGYVDFISTVLLCAPDSFIERDYLSAEDQLNLERAFEVLDGQFFLIEKRMRDKAVLPELRRLMQTSLDAYRSGDDMMGSRLIQDFRKLILQNAKRRGW